MTRRVLKKEKKQILGEAENQKRNARMWCGLERAS
jgi:hypothetical protein